MMQNGNDYAITVRKPDGDIEVKKGYLFEYYQEAQVSWSSLCKRYFQFYRFHGSGHEGPHLVLQLFEG